MNLDAVETIIKNYEEEVDIYHGILRFYRRRKRANDQSCEVQNNQKKEL